MGLIPDHADNRCRSVSALDAHVFESRRVPWAELALDDDPVAHRLHATSLNPSEHRHTLASGDHPGERSNRGAQARWPARPLPRARSRRSSRRRRRAGTRAPRRAGRRPRLRRRIGKGRARTKTLRCRTSRRVGRTVGEEGLLAEGDAAVRRDAAIARVLSGDGSRAALARPCSPAHL
jgi:hypothetical protein